jgi:hypothetical protein
VGYGKRSTDQPASNLQHMRTGLEPSGDRCKGAGQDNSTVSNKRYRSRLYYVCALRICRDELLLEHTGHSRSFTDLHRAASATGSASASCANYHNSAGLEYVRRSDRLHSTGAVQYRSICVRWMSDQWLRLIW